MFYWFSFYILWVVSKIFCPITVEGYESLPKQDGFIIASNHSSNADPILVGLAAKRKVSYMAKDSLFKNKILGFILKLVNTFPVKRDTADIRSIREALRRLKTGSPLLLFPEGTRGKSDSGKNIKSGIGMLATRSGVMVVPTKIIGSERVLPPGAKFLRRHPVKIIFGNPFSYSKEDDYEQVSSQIMAAVKSL